MSSFFQQDTSRLKLTMTKNNMKLVYSSDLRKCQVSSCILFHISDFMLTVSLRIGRLTLQKDSWRR